MTIVLLPKGGREGGRKEGEGGGERRAKGEEGWGGEEAMNVFEKYNSLGHDLSCMVSSHGARC